MIYKSFHFDFVHVNRSYVGNTPPFENCHSSVLAFFISDLYFTTRLYAFAEQRTVHRSSIGHFNPLPPQKKIRKEMRYWEKNWFAVGYDTSYASLRNRLHFITRRRNVNYAWSLRKFLILYWFNGSVVGSVLNPFQAWKYAQRHINWFIFDIISIFLGIIGNLWIGAINTAPALNKSSNKATILAGGLQF